jgi:arsenite-activated ATPase ArsA
LKSTPRKQPSRIATAIIEPLRDVAPEAEVRHLQEQLSGACTTEIAAFDEFTALLTDSSLVAEYDHIIFDTAPTGHTIRLLQLPSAWSDFLKEGKGDTSCLGPLAGLEKQQSQYQDAVAALADPELTRLVLVARAQASTLREAARTQEELASIGLHQQHLVINGVLPSTEAKHDKLAAAVYEREQAAVAAIPEALKALPRDQITLKGFNLVGLEALRLLLGDTKQPPESLASEPQGELNAPVLSAMVDDIAADNRGLVMVMGKGGVGKTTIAAAIAVELAERGLSVHLTTSDPAAHLTETLSEELEHLSVSRIDPKVETENYRQKVLESKGANMDAQDKALLEEDLRSPCTEEVAVFQAFSHVIREAGKKFVVMDTAPTGHTLMLLDATGAYHREVERQMSKSPLHYTTPMMQLQDPKRTKVVLVTLPETTPVLEAAELQDDLRRADIEPWAWIINNSIAATQTSSPLLSQRANAEHKEINAVARDHAKRYAVVPLLEQEPVGIDNLLLLSRGRRRNSG